MKQEYRGFMEGFDWSKRMMLREMDPDGMTPSVRLMAARRKAGYTRPELARKLGVHRSTVWRYERARRASIDREVLAKWGELCNETPHWLETGKGWSHILWSELEFWARFG